MRIIAGGVFVIFVFAACGMLATGWSYKITYNTNPIQDKQYYDYLQYRFDTLETKIEQMQLEVKLTADEKGDCSLVTVKEMK